MRLLILLSGIFVCGTGAFCFAFYTSTFADVAFLVGVTMLVAGACNTIAYLISGKGAKKLTETTLVEGLTTLLYGFSVLSNQVTDSMMTMFFGTWLTLCGVTRFSQSLYVSRFNTKDWIKIIPLSIIESMLGMVMMLPWILESVMPLMLVGGSFLLDGLSMIVYAMYMKGNDQEMAEGEARAKARAEAKKAQHQAEKEERDRLRNLSNSERKQEEAKRRKAEKLAEEKRARLKEEKRRARRAAARPESEITIRLEDKEVEQINAAASQIEAEKQEGDETVSSKITWNMPESIPSLRANRDVQEKKPEPVVTETMIKAVNLEELEEKSPEVKFEKVELPEVKFASDTERVDRESLIESLDSFKVKSEEKIAYEKIDLDELVKEPMNKTADPDDATRFTQTLDFSWVQRLNEELNKK